MKQTMCVIICYLLVIGCAAHPSNEMYEILINPVFGLFVTYLEGSPLRDRDLTRACAESAIAVFVMTNKFSANHDEEDAKTIMLYTNIRRHITLCGKAARPMYGMQLIRSENRRHVVLDDPFGNKELVLCVNEMKLGFMAKACLFPGSFTLIFNLLSSFSDTTLKDRDSRLQGLHDEETALDDGRRGSQGAADMYESWVEEYTAGCEWEIYVAPKLAKRFLGHSFKEVASYLYCEFGIVLFGLRIREVHNRKAFVVLNPGDFKLPVVSISMEGFVIAKSKSSWDISTKGMELHTGRPFNGLKRGSDPSVTVPSESGSQRRSGRRGAVTNRQTPRENRRSVYEVKRNDSSEGEMGEGGSALSLPVAEATTHKPSLWKTSIDDAMRASPTAAPATVVACSAIPPSRKWKEMCAKANLVMGDSINPEEMHRLEDLRLQEEFFVLSSPWDLHEVTIRTSVEQECPHLKKLMILISRDVNNIYDFVYHFRQKNLGRLQHIVILSPDEIPHSVWSKICMFESIYIVRGSPNQVNDLRRAGIFRASSVVIIADPPTDVQKGHSTGIDAMVDADAIFIYHLVKKLNDKAHVVVELVRTENVRYLDTQHLSDYAAALTMNYHTTAEFASGTLFLSSIVDTIIPQVCNTLSEILASNLRLCTQAYYNAHLLVIVNKLLKPAGDDDVIELINSDQVPSSSLYQIAIPEDLDEPKTYGTLFLYLSERGILPLGLYRSKFANMIGSKRNRLPYVYCNPPKDAPLYSCDRVFVLSQSAPRTTTQVLQCF